MKKTLTINLGGTVFHIDEDAYLLLHEYLSNLRLHFRKEEGADEIVNDIEARISELFSETISENAQVITIQNVESIIERMGKPEELTGGEDEGPTTRNNTSSFSDKKETPKAQRRLYRNPDDMILGGVLSGLAAYLGWNVTSLRLVVFISMFFTQGTILIAYIVGWIAIPLARTAAEKLNMRGEEVTMENIGKTVTDNFEKATQGVDEFMKSDKPRHFLQKAGDALVSVIGFLLKMFLLLFAIVLSPALFVLAIILVVFIVAIISVLIGGGTVLFSLLPTLSLAPMTASPAIILASSIAGVLLVGIPVASLVFAIFQSVFKWKPMSTGMKWTLFLLWFASIVVFILTLAQMSWQLPGILL